MNTSSMYKGERVIAARQEVESMEVHLQRLLSVNPSIDTSKPHAWDLPHLRSRPKKKQLEEDRQREISIENTQLMRRLTHAMKGAPDDGEALRRHRDMVTKARDYSCRKARSALSAQNAKLARSISAQKPFYSTQAMRSEESERQSVLQGMSRAARRRQNAQAIDSLYRSQVVLLGLDTSNSGEGEHGTGIGGRRASSGGSTRRPHQLPLNYGAAELARDLTGGVLFKDGQVQEDFKLRTARQMRAEVAKVQGRAAAAAAAAATADGTAAVGQAAQLPQRRAASVGGTSRGRPQHSLKGNGSSSGSGGPLSMQRKGSACVMHVSNVPGSGAAANLILCHTLRPPPHMAPAHSTGHGESTSIDGSAAPAHSAFVGS